MTRARSPQAALIDGAAPIDGVVPTDGAAPIGGDRGARRPAPAPPSTATASEGGDKTFRRLAGHLHDRELDPKFRLATLNLLEDARIARERSERAALQQQQAEARAQEAQAEFRASFETSLVGFALADPASGRLSRVNAALCGMLGFSERDLLERTLWQLLHPLDIERGRDAIERMVAGEADGYRGELRFVDAEGTIVWIELAVNAIRSAGGEPLRTVAVLQDITRRKRAESDREVAIEALRASEAHLRLIVDNAREYAIVSLDTLRRITSWNTGATAILGYTSDEARGRPIDFIFTPEDRASGAPSREARVSMTEERASDERWHVHKDGHRIWGSGAMMPMRNGRGEVIGLVKILRDQTPELRTKEALERSREELWHALQAAEVARADAESAARAKDQFLAVLSHELRTPLTPVVIATHTLVRRQDLPEAVIRALNMIRRNVEIEARFVDDLLDITRINRGKMEIERDRIDLHDAIALAIEVSRPDVEAKRQTLDVDLGAACHHVDGDVTRLQQAVWNLVKNASKFSAADTTITLRTRDEGGRIVVTVRDEGIGIDADKLTAIFDPFVQADGSITRRFGGLGLGLAIARASVDAHGGELRAESPGTGRGATFVMSLPCLPPEAPAPAQADASRVVGNATP